MKGVKVVGIMGLVIVDVEEEDEKHDGDGGDVVDEIEIGWSIVVFAAA